MNSFIVLYDTTGRKHSEVVQIKRVKEVLRLNLRVLNLSVGGPNPGVIHKPPPRTALGTLLCLGGRCSRSDHPFRHTRNQQKSLLGCSRWRHIWRTRIMQPRYSFILWCMHNKEECVVNRALGYLGLLKQSWLGYLGLALPLFSSESPIRISAPSSRSGFVSMLVMLTENTLWALRRSSRHQGLMSLLVCEQEPCSHVLSWLPSMALYADPNWYRDDCAAFPWRAKFSPAETTGVFDGCCFSGNCFVISGSRWGLSPVGAG